MRLKINAKYPLMKICDSLININLYYFNIVLLVIFFTTEDKLNTQFKFVNNYRQNKH